MISCETFCKLLNHAIELEEKDKALSEALQIYSGDKEFTRFVSSEARFIVAFLEEAMGDTTGAVSWWMWDCPEKGQASDPKVYMVEENGKTFVLKTPADLYMYLLQTVPIQVDQRQLLVAAQTEGVKFALRQLFNVYKDNVLSDMDVDTTGDADGKLSLIAKLMMSKIQDNYKKTTGVGGLVDPITCEVGNPVLFSK